MAMRDNIPTKFPNDFRRKHFAGKLRAKYGDETKLGDQPVKVKVAGRLMSRRVIGKSTFAHMQDMSGQLQLYLRAHETMLDDDEYATVTKYNIGDIIAAEGELFFTKTGELTVRVKTIRRLVEAQRPLPEKYHGLSDAELKYRMRYVDLIMSEKTRKVFEIRAQAIQVMREFMLAKNFMEVETPMMHPIPGGALARPFVTHHNALDMKLYLRIAPELYLKRLVVGGFERVFEINRNFRNEGVGTKHNPEFTMLEFYFAYADYQDAMTMTEELVREVCRQTTQGESITYQGDALNFSEEFTRLSMLDAIVKYNPAATKQQLSDEKFARKFAEQLGMNIDARWGIGKLQMEIFEKTAEHKLIAPTFITGYPVEVSPLSRRNDDDPTISDRFELFIGGREVANGFSELNDPRDQAARFKQQLAAHESGDAEAMQFDADYIRALEYGLPPTAGVGLGVDRLVMLLTDSKSIRDVLLFPHMRAEK